MGYVKVWVHLVWATKCRKPLLTKDIRSGVFKHIRENAREKGIYVDYINGYLEHVHCLISLESGQNIDKIMMLLKGESSYWINKNKTYPGKFEWQESYFAVSVSESGVNRVRDYIKNQENHHRKKNFDDEYQKFISRYGFEVMVSG
ncbi:MAG: IS200/IS605 family transposase [Bacteroidetes bacterium]|nr:IS200/IS605 family transposase [Bacteroidota bacterium]